MRPIRALLVFAAGADNATLSYQTGWPRHFMSHPAFDCTPVNLSEPGWSARIRRMVTLRRASVDAVIMLHSVFSNMPVMSRRMFEAIRDLPQPKAFFIGNEYKLMPDKMQFCEEIGVTLLVSQSSHPAVHDAYRRRLGCVVVGLPNTGLDTTLFRPTTVRAERPIDLGYRTMPGVPYLGHTEREDIAEYFRVNAAPLGLVVDISLDPQKRFAEPEWAAFLNRCKGQLGTEAGGDVFELTDATRVAVNEFVDAHPGAPMSEIRARFFTDATTRVPMRILSGRNVEAAGTRTVQILFEGWYDGYFQPDVHYIPLKKDFSNVDEAIARFRDCAFAERIADNAYDLVTREFTYNRLLTRFHEALAPLVA
jgi:hypothetical protein